MAYLTIRADEVRPGDEWLPNSDDRVLVEAVELTVDEAFAHHGMGSEVARISGKITKGWGRGTTGTWTKIASTAVEVLR